MQSKVCKACGFIVLDLSEAEECPVCGARSFEEQEQAVFKAGDKTDFAEGEKKHIPAIIVANTCGLIEGCRDAFVTIGEVIHPMTVEHSIQYIDFYLNKKFLARMQLQSKNINPGAMVHLKEAAGTLTVIERCNLHGAWINEVEL